jgi:hypothetical protein
MTHGTIEETFEYHVKSIIKKALWNKSVADFKNEEELDSYLSSHRKDLADAFLDDVQEWMGLGELLSEMKRDEN